MKKFSILALFALGAMTVAAQNKIDLPGCDIVSATRDLNLTGSRSALELKTVPLDVALDKQYTVIVTSDLSADQLAENGAEVIAVRGDMAIVRVTATAMEQLAAMPQVSGISLGVGAKANMDMARAVTEVNALHDGKVLGGTKYTGAGVIAGIMDEGLDPNHMNFLNADGSLRTSRVWTVRGANGLITEYLTPERIASFTTDDRKKTHGTHVLGIMAGSYNGPAKYIFVNSRGATQLRQQTVPTSKIPYYGIATEAELAVACGEFLNNNVEIGAEKVAEYAKSVGKPAVVNLSIGNTYGPHDGTDANSRWLERIGEDVILCIAAGNDGDEPVSIRKSFTASNRSLRTFVGRVATTGIVDFWGADDSVYDVTFIAYNIETGETLYSYKLDRNLKGESLTIAGSRYNAPGYIKDANFDKYFGTEGFVRIISNVSPNNNRYNVYVNLSLEGDATTATSKVRAGFIVEGKAGTSVDGYAYAGPLFQSFGVAGFTDGDAKCSISGLACGKNVIVVGSYTNREEWPTLDAGMLHYTNFPKLAQISSFSSYGTTFDGRQLPDICAPGGSLISSYSKYYIESSSEKELQQCTGVYTGTKRDSHWSEMQGTSMATPVVSGIVATWLQADPTLTVDDIKAVMKRTAKHDEYTAVEPHRWGMGKIDALAGIKDILGLSGISDVRADEAEIFITSADGRNYEISVPGVSGVTAEVYSVAGVKLASVVSDGDTAALTLDNLAPGVYVLRAASSSATATRKISIR